MKTWIKKSPSRKRVALWFMRVATPFTPPSFLGCLFGYVRFFRDLARFRNLGGKAKILDWYPCLFDRTPTTAFDAQYLYQAAWGAKMIFAQRPEVHFDVGSHLGFVTQLTAFTTVEFIDLRPANVSIRGFSVNKGLITALPMADGSIRSISCMHVIEHIGLGRYGDPIQSDGPDAACKEMVRVLAGGGRAYISVPIGRPRIAFNGHRIFDAQEFPLLFKNCEVVAFAYVDAAGHFFENVDYKALTIEPEGCGSDFGLGIYVLEKL